MPYPRQRPARRDGTGRQEKMTVVARYPDSTKTSLEQRLRARARERWPQIASLQIRHHGVFSYVDATLPDATTLKLCRLRRLRRLRPRLAVRDLPRQPRRLRRIGLPHRPARRQLPRRPRHRLRPLPQRPTAWTRPPTNLRARPLSYSAPASSEFGLRHISSELVGVAGFEPAASSSRTSGTAGRLAVVPASSVCWRSCWLAAVRGRCCTSVLYSAPH
jgi:hypothetical protein